MDQETVREGRRIFRMTPFHHHLELGGLFWKWPKLVQNGKWMPLCGALPW